MSDDLLCFRAGPDTVARAYQLAAQRGVDLDGLLPVLIREVDSREFETQLHAEIAHLRGRIAAVLALEEPADGPDEEDFHNGQRWMLKKVRSRLLGATDTTPAEPAPMPEFPTNDDRICANAIAEAIRTRYGAVKFSLVYQSARQVMDTCGAWAAAADARETAGMAEVAAADELTAHDQAIGIYDDPAPATGHWIAPGVPCHGCQICLVPDCPCAVGAFCSDHDQPEEA